MRIGKGEFNTVAMRQFFFLAKVFEKKEHAEQFTRGKLYANRLSHYKGMEKGGDTIRGDKYEGISDWLRPDKFTLTIDGMNLSDDAVEPFSISPDQLNHLNIFCLYAGTIESSKLAGMKNVLEVKKALLIPEKCESLGRFAVLIKNGSEFFKRVERAALLRNYKLVKGMVKYYDPVKFHGSFPGWEAVFNKRDNFEYQREYRIAFDTRTRGTDAKVLKIGDISHITMCIGTADINKNMEIENNLTRGPL